MDARSKDRCRGSKRHHLQPLQLNDPIRQSRPSLSVALRRYWRNLIGIATFPAVSILGDRYLHLPPLVFIPIFIAVSLHALWPYLARRAPYSFWLVACGVYMGGAVFAVLVIGLISIIHTQSVVHQLLIRPPR
jgi:hypothetical protein